MSDGTPTPPTERRDPLDGGRRRVRSAYLRADAILDHGQHRAFRLLWFFLPETSIARNPRFQQIMASRFLSDAGQQALAFGAIVAIVRDGGSAFDAALVGVAALVPPALFGLYGGAVADALPQRVALAFVYNLQAALCFAVPFLLGTGLTETILLIFAVNVLGQVSGPTESSVVPVVASDEELASAASLVTLSSNLGTAFGTAVLAPVLVRAFGVDVVFYVAGVLLLLAASRVFDLATPERARRMNWRRPQVNVRRTITWIIHERAVATMMVVAVLAGTANIVVQVLAPRYVSSVIGVDPADSVYVFAPTALGLAVALLAAPRLIRLLGERGVALAGFVLISGALMLLGFVGDDLALALDPINPLRLLAIVDIDLGSRLRTAGFIAIALGFGFTLTTTSVQTYINRRVPLSYQGRAFALQSVLKNGTAIVPLLTLGALATVVDVETVLIVSPILLGAAAFALIELSVVFGGAAPARRLDVLASFWEESDVPVGNPDEELASRLATEPEHAGGDEHQRA
ncbi:MAG: MFS transporter [Dehalococcoidia bacterium]